MGELKDNDVDASEIDVDDLFASPSKIPGKDQLDASRTPGVTHGPTDPRPPGGRFDAEESRQAALEAELEGVRNVNKTIEGVVNSLDRAKQNMEVCTAALRGCYTGADARSNTDGLSHHCLCIDALEHLDSGALADRTQSTSHTQSRMARRHSRPCGSRK